MSDTNPMHRLDDNGNAVPMTTEDELRDLGAAHLQSYSTLQRLTFLLEEKGLLTPDELAYLYDEGPKP